MFGPYDFPPKDKQTEAVVDFRSNATGDGASGRDADLLGNLRLVQERVGRAFQLSTSALRAVAGSFSVAAEAAKQFQQQVSQMNELMLMALQDERERGADWDVAIKAMEPALGDLKAQGFSRNIRMEAIYETGALGEKVCIGYRLSAFNGVETKEKVVLFPMMEESE